jgi:putative transposase
LISPDPQISVRHQCELLEVCRGSYYYQCCPETEENLALMRRLDQMHLDHPVYPELRNRKSVALRKGLWA